MITNAQDDSLTIDTAKLEEVMAIIESHPELHEQRAWAIGDFAEELAKGIENMTPLKTYESCGAMVTDCGTAACFAGWASNLYAKELGYHPVHGGRWFAMEENYSSGLDTAALTLLVLGLTEEQGDKLFHGGNTIAMLRSMVKDLCNTGDLRERDLYEQEDAGV